MIENVTSYWNQFVKKSGIENATYDAWAFGDNKQDANKLADLVVTGVKTATTSAYELYEPDEPIPQVGDYNIILNWEGQPVCITRTEVVEILPFKWVSWEHAYHEGEGDKSLWYWRQVHEAFFKREYAQNNGTFSYNIPCVCEVFKVVDRP